MAKEYIEREATIKWIMQLHCDYCGQRIDWEAVDNEVREH